MKNFALTRDGKFKSLSIMRTSAPMKMNKVNYAVVAIIAGWLLTSGHALRADIVQPTAGFSASWPGSLGVTGQSFTADSSVTSLLSIGFLYRDSNTHLGAPKMGIDLFDGAGFGGTLMDSQVMVANTAIGNHWEDFDFSGNSLTSGQTYSFRLTGGPGAGGFNYTQSNAYAGGSWLSGMGFPRNGDMTFRILGVPEPSTALLLCLGLMVLAAGRWNR